MLCPTEGPPVDNVGLNHRPACCVAAMCDHLGQATPMVQPVANHAATIQLRHHASSKCMMLDGLLAGCSLDKTQTHMPLLSAMTMPPHSAWTHTCGKLAGSKSSAT